MAAAYALGALDASDLAEFRAHLAEGCGECRREVAEYQEVLVQLAEDLRRNPPPRAGGALLDRIRRVPHRRPAPARFWPGLRWVASVAVAAALVAAVATVFVSAWYEARLGRTAREVAALREQIGQERQALVLLRDPATQVISLGGLDPSPGAQGRMIWSEREGGVFVAAHLPPLPPGKAYELWAIAGTGPIPAAVFTVDAEGAARARVAPLAGAPPVRQFAVTLEPAGGVPSPSGPMLLVSK